MAGSLTRAMWRRSRPGNVRAAPGDGSLAPVAILTGVMRRVSWGGTTVVMLVGLGMLALVTIACAPAAEPVAVSPRTALDARVENRAAGRPLMLPTATRIPTPEPVPTEPRPRIVPTPTAVPARGVTRAGRPSSVERTGRFTVDMDGSPRDIDLAMVIPLERVRVSVPVYCFMPDWTNSLGKLISPDTDIVFEIDPALEARSGVARAYVWSGGVLVSEALVRAGLAQVDVRDSGGRLYRAHRDAERTARNDGAGVWSNLICTGRLPR